MILPFTVQLETVEAAMRTSQQTELKQIQNYCLLLKFLLTKSCSDPLYIPQAWEVDQTIK